MGKCRGIAGVAVLIAGLLLFGTTHPARAQNFFEGKTITITIGFGPGGAYDSYTRLLAPFLTKHIPGNPTVIVANRPGAGGISAYNHAAKQAPKDGTLIHIASQGLLLTELTGGEGLQASLADFHWIGNVTQSNNVTATWHTSSIKSMDDARTREVTLASSGAGSTSSQMAFAYNNLLGTRFKPIMGYEGGAASNLAMERGETEGRATNTWTGYKASYPDPKSKLNVLVQIGLRKEPDLPDVPLLTDLLKNDPRKHAVALIISQTLALARCFAVPPGTPADRVEILRKAFDASMKDPELLENAKKQELEISPMTGIEVQNTIRQVLAAPADLKTEVKAALGIGK
jgi:tripartite-type tricarboxylate transporter receptor subunit TctC